MHNLKIKPLSVNDAWKGRRFRSDDYKAYSQHLTLILPRKIEIPDGPLEIHLRWYFSSDGSDWDNPIKPTQDIICAKYGIKDNRFRLAIVEKHLVKKGHDRIDFHIKQFEKYIL